MTKVLIGVPTLDAVDASFFNSFVTLEYLPGNKYSFDVKSNSLVYNARNDFVLDAIQGNYEYLAMLDSDMVLPQDTLSRLLTDIEENDFDLVTGLYFTRRLPTSPVILKDLDWYEDEKLGAQEFTTVYEDYPRDMFQIAGCGLGCCIIRVDLLKTITWTYKMPPFTPLPRLSEDYAFCWRAKKLNAEMWCDPKIKPLHAGLKLYGEADWKKQKEEKKNG